MQWMTELYRPTRLIILLRPLRPPHDPTPSSGVSTPAAHPFPVRNLKLAHDPELERGCPPAWWSVGALII